MKEITVEPMYIANCMMITLIIGLIAGAVLSGGWRKKKSKTYGK
ncbi:MAG: hypothetical protein ACI9N9_000035 [Enterobacterales bacterium]|jgi:hypothetical protein